MVYGTIRLERDGPIATVRLDRPERMNAVNEEMYVEILDALATLSSDDEIRCLVLTGTVLHRNGVDKQAFCAGADLKKHAAGERTPEQRRHYIELAHRATRSIHQLPRPVIAAVNGPARGAGAEMALACDLVFMAEEATLAFPETGVGSFVGGGVTLLLPRIVGLARAKDLIYSGRVIDGREALALGLAVRCCPVNDLFDEVRDYARELAARAPFSMRLAKQHLQRHSSSALAIALEAEGEAILACMETEDWAEGARAFAEKRRPLFTGR
jgi:enoyl-CoA hydratase